MKRTTTHEDKHLCKKRNSLYQQLEDIEQDLSILRKRGRMFLDADGQDWSDIFWRTSHEGFACMLDDECKGFAWLCCRRWRLPRYEICSCPVGWTEAKSVPGTSSDWCKIMWFPTPWTCKQDWHRVALWKVPEGKNLFGKTPHAKAYRVPGESATYADYRYLPEIDRFIADLWSSFNSRQAAYAPLTAELMQQLEPTANAHSLKDKDGNRIIRFSHECR